MKVTPKYIDQVRDKLDAIIKKEKLNLNIKFGNATYDEDSFTIKLKVSLPNAKSEEEKALEHELKVRKANKSWMKPLDPTKIYSLNNNFKYTLCGYRPRAKSKPFIVLNLINQKKYIISEEQAEKYFSDPNWKNEIKVSERQINT
jgi:hypothetical protein|tara:strand:+ start:83 stop:517 length:435 start_codon:yes stop_codon:yes gene_type:complete